MVTEGDLQNSMDQSDKVRELQDKIASLRAQVSDFFFAKYSWCTFLLVVKSNYL